MSVGLMDADMMTYSLVPFNLELMKLSAYYKKKGEIVIFSPTFSPERNTLFIYRKDYDDGDYPSGLTWYKNTEYGGLAFSNNIYQPLPLEIERMRPDTSIYEKAESIIMSAAGRESAKKKIFQNRAHILFISFEGAIDITYTRIFSYYSILKDIIYSLTQFFA